jgi:GNAT superfamily N-acetyltransferase
MDARPVDLARARREAKALLRAARAGEPEAVARVGVDAPKLSDAQLAVARELGARSWPALVRRVERGRSLVLAATSGRLAEAEAVLDPALARAALDVALVIGEAGVVGAALADDPGVATRAMGTREWPPLLYVTYSAFVGGERTDGLLACARALLDAGADPNAAWVDDEHERRTALHGAAGVAHEPRMTALVLAAGADPDDGRSLRMAAGAEDPACLELLLDAGATLYRSMALAHAAQRGALRTARVLLERGPEQWGERANALVWAVRGEAPAEMLRLLASNGADLEASFDGSGRTPYGEAVRAGRRDLAEELASLGAAASRAARRARRRVPGGRRRRRAAGGRGAPRRGAPPADLGGRRPRPCGGPRPAGRSRGPPRPRGAGRRPRPCRRNGARRSPRVRPRRRRRPAARARGGPAQAGAEAERSRSRAAAPRLRAAYAELAWAAEAAYLRILSGSPLAETRPVGDGFAVVTGIADNTENGVVARRADDNEIAGTLAWFAERRVPAQWFVGEASDLGERLVAFGASPERTGVVMGAELDGLALDAPAPPGVTIVAVRDAATLVAWREDRARVLESLGLGADSPVQHRLAVRDGRAVGVASFMLHGATAYGQHLGVLAPERRGGVGRALAEHVLREARAAGARTALLGPTPDTIAFYRLLGFVLRPYLRDRSLYLPLSAE